jgi:hypothetical protein
LRRVGTLLLLVLALCAPNASAQDRNAIGPFRLGMSVQDFRAVASQPEHRLPSPQTGLPSNESVARMEWLGERVIVIATHTQNVVHTLTFELAPSIPTAQACQLFHTRIARDVADQFGTLDERPVAQTFPVGPGDPESPNTPTAEFEPVFRMLTDGTIIALYTIDQTQTQVITSGRAGPPSIDLATWQRGNEQGQSTCETSVVIWDQQLRASARAIEDAETPPQPTQNEEVRATLGARIAQAERLTNPSFIRFPEEPIWRVYPADAVRQRQEGDVLADCLVKEDGSLECLIVTEEPLGWGFGAAALQIFSEYRVDVTDGAAGKYVRMRMPFRYT